VDEIEWWLADVRARMLAAQAMALKCPSCGQALPHGVQVEDEKPKLDGPGLH